LRGAFIEGESCEMLSRPENARNEPAKPTRIELGVSDACANILAKREGNSEMGMWVKTVQMTARSLIKAMRAPNRLTLALSPIRIQFNKPSSKRTLSATSRLKGKVVGSTTLKYWTRGRQLMAAERRELSSR